jgi:malate dehydrogenase (oxaloacetate-decarboxylating)(NADP+)
MDSEELKRAALHYHAFPQSGKLLVQPKKSMVTQGDLSLAYTPGVAYPCLEIEKNPDDAYRYTIKSNLIAVISNGTAVLGLGNIGALASKPVMEGKSMLFKKFSFLDAFDIEVDRLNVEKFCEAVEAIAPTFGGINLEDIKAPECFAIEERLVKNLQIPVMHDDQHGTAVISMAGIMNACKITKRELYSLKIVIVGAGAAAIGCARFYREAGIKNIVMIDSKGVIDKSRGVDRYKAEFVAAKPLTLSEAFEGADVVVGLSRPGTFSEKEIKLMAPNPIIFALANPTPEIDPMQVQKIRPDAIVATGRSDMENQVNNVLGFPFIFRGAIDVRASSINTQMKLAASKALAELAQQNVPGYIEEIYQRKLHFGKEYIIPKPFDKRLIVEVSAAVAEAAVQSGVSKKKEFDIKVYKNELSALAQQE